MTQPLQRQLQQSHSDCDTCALAWAHGWSGQCDPQREATQRDTCTQHKRAALRDVWKHTIIAVAVSFAVIAIIYGIVQAATHATAGTATGIDAVYTAMQHSLRAVAFELGFIGLVCAAAVIHEACMRASDAVYDHIHTRVK